METTPCTTCGHPTIADRQYRKLGRPEGVRRRCSTDTCSRCYVRRDRAHRVPRAAGRGVPRDLQLLDWNWLHETGQLREDEPLKQRIRYAAPRIGVSFAALETTLVKAGVRNPVERPMPDGWAA